MNFPTAPIVDRPAVVALLYATDDDLGRRRTELMVGPLLLDGAVPMRVPVTAAGDPQIDAAQIHRQGGWMTAGTLHPDSVIDTLPPWARRSPALEAWLQALPHTYAIRDNRFALLQYLARDPDVSAHVVATQPVDSPERVWQTLQTHGALVLKPVSEGGPGTIHLRRAGEAVQWCDAQRDHTVDKDALLHALIGLCDGRWMMQPALSTQSARGYPYALHITVQQRGDGAWMIPTLQCLLATDKPLASLRAGAEHLGTPFAPLWDNVVIPKTHPGAAGLQLRLQGFGIALACALQRRWPSHHLGALAFRVLLDAQLKPWVVNVWSRTPAPTRAARNLEFFKHWSALALGLCRREAALAGAVADIEHAPPVSKDLVRDDGSADLGSIWGVSVRSQLTPTQQDALVQSMPAWLDVGLGPGSRSLLARLAQSASFSSPLPPSQPAQQPGPRLSLRLGMAAPDWADPQNRWARIQPLEDYAGRDLLRWPELRLMRSLRLPLLQTQWGELARAMAPLKPDVVWLDDLDLALRALPVGEQRAQLQTSLRWFADGVGAGNWPAWGLVFYNAATTQTRSWLQTAVGMARDLPGFWGVCLRSAVPTETLDWLDVQAVAVALADPDLALAQGRACLQAYRVPAVQPEGAPC
ncbi:MAG: hypothetical protein Fur007_12790 [Rhodoferax sp.]